MSQSCLYAHNIYYLPTPQTCCSQWIFCTSAVNQFVREIEHGSFTPLIISATGGVGQLRQTFAIRDRAPILSVKWTHALLLIRCKLSICYDSIQCLRDSRSSPHASLPSPCQDHCYRSLKLSFEPNPTLYISALSSFHWHSPPKMYSCAPL